MMEGGNKAANLIRAAARLPAFAQKLPPAPGRKFELRGKWDVWVIWDAWEGEGDAYCHSGARLRVLADREVGPAT